MVGPNFKLTSGSFQEVCNDKPSRDDGLITLNVMRERRELDGVSW